MNDDVLRKAELRYFCGECDFFTVSSFLREEDRAARHAAWDHMTDEHGAIQRPERRS